MKRFFLIFAVLTLFATASIHSQSAGNVTKMISTEKASWGQVSYFSAIARGLVSEDASNADAFAALQKSGIAASDKNALSAITFAELAHVCAQTWQVNNSLMYKIAPSPRYAFTMMKANGIIPYTTDPSSVPSGRDVLNIINATIELSEKNKGGKK